MDKLFNYEVKKNFDYENGYHITTDINKVENIYNDDSDKTINIY